MLLFTRYFMRVGESMPVAGKRETLLMKRGRQRIIWEVAMSCLAIAVKVGLLILKVCFFTDQSPSLIGISFTL